MPARAGSQTSPAPTASGRTGRSTRRRRRRSAPSASGCWPPRTAAIRRATARQCPPSAGLAAGQRRVAASSSDRTVPNVMRTRDRSQVGQRTSRAAARSRRWSPHQQSSPRPACSWNTNWRTTPVRLAQLAQSPPVELPPRLLLRSVRLGLSAVRHRLAAVAELLFEQHYWINDPCEYRLPYAPPGTRWIRYYNDALLVDMYTGEVVDVIRDFFW